MSADPTNPKVTVLIAAYNAEAFLTRAIRSALEQSDSVFEVLVVDDASTDRTIEVASAAALLDSRVRVVALPTNSGPSMARNAGLDAARGEWVAILDADDAYAPGRIDRMIDAARTSSAEIVADNFAWFDPSIEKMLGVGIPQVPGIEHIGLNRYLARARPFAGEADWGLLKPIFNLPFLNQHLLRYPRDSRHGEDFLFIISCFLAGAKYALIRDVGYLYTIRSAGQSRTRIDYGQMAADTTALLQHEIISSEQELVRLVEQRVRAVQRLSIQHAVRSRFEQRQAYHAVLLAFKGPSYAREVVLHLWSAFRSRLRRIKARGMAS